MDYLGSQHKLSSAKFTTKLITWSALVCLQVASPFAQFVKDLPPITPPRVQWDAACNWPGQPGLSPALATFTTPQLATE